MKSNKRTEIYEWMKDNPGWHGINVIGNAVGVEFGAASKIVIFALIVLHEEGFVERKREPMPDIGFGYRFKKKSLQIEMEF